MQVPKASDGRCMCVLGAAGGGGGAEVGRRQLMTFTRPCEYIHLFVPDPEPNAGLEDETGSVHGVYSVAEKMGSYTNINKKMRRVL